ncbi:MAG: CopG family transcriptional regulator [Anaerolineae bacterium]|jgi:metal-responsive CopG/Arc/MetJ family transcriptional regulator|nr:CopG family transcriptional regulator [Anaerolineae bacterium]
MATIKTAISMQESLFEQVDALAEELHVPRSQVFVLAVEEFIKRHQNQKLLEALNEAYAEVSAEDEESLREEMRQQHRDLVEGQW